VIKYPLTILKDISDLQIDVLIVRIINTTLDKIYKMLLSTLKAFDDLYFLAVPTC